MNTINYTVLTSTFQHTPDAQQLWNNAIVTYLFGGPLEASNNTVLDLVKILDTFRDVDDNVGSSAFWSEAPDLTSLGGVIVVLLRQIACTLLHLLAWSYITLHGIE